MNDQDRNRLYLQVKRNVRQKSILWRDLINFLIFSIIFFGFNMVFTPGLWWSIIPIGIYALIIVATHSSKIHTLLEEQAIQKEIARLKKIEKLKTSLPTQIINPENENLKIKSESSWDEEEMV